MLVGLTCPFPPFVSFSLSQVDRGKGAVNHVLFFPFAFLTLPLFSIFLASQSAECPFVTPVLSQTPWRTGTGPALPTCSSGAPACMAPSVATFWTSGTCGRLSRCRAHRAHASLNASATSRLVWRRWTCRTPTCLLRLCGARLSLRWRTCFI